MGKKYENISPAIFALPCLLIMEAIHAAHIIPQDHIKDFQLISNTLLLIIGVYSLFSARVQTNHFKSNTLVYFLSNSLVVLCGYILNIDVFENKIHQISDLWTKWHILWLIGSLVLILLFSDIGKNSYKSIVSIFRYLTNRIKIIIGWGENTIKNSHKGVISYVVFGMIAWIYFLVIDFTKGNISVENFSKRSLVFWSIWFMICTLLTLFANFIPKIKPIIENFNPEKILKYFMGVVTLTLAVLQVLPLLFQVLGTIISCLLIFLLLIGALFYTGIRILPKLKSMYWSDICVVLAIVLITFMLVPMLGASTQEGGNTLASDQIEDLKKYIELFTAGLELIKALF